VTGWGERVLEIEVVKVGVGLAFLLWASYHDWVRREVPNIVWKVFFPVALVLTVFESYTLGFPTALNLLQIVSVGLSVGIFIIIFYLGLWGGADSKALIGLAVLFPLPPLLADPLLGYTLQVFPMVVFLNALLLSLAGIPYAVVRNLAWRRRTGRGLFEGYEGESLLRKVGALLLCVKVRAADVKPYDMLAEEPSADRGGGQRRLVLFRKVEEDYHPPKAEELPSDVFITAALPMLIFITLGFMTAFVLGDVIFWLLTRLMVAL